MFMLCRGTFPCRIAVLPRHSGRNSCSPYRISQNDHCIQHCFLLHLSKVSWTRRTLSTQGESHGNFFTVRDSVDFRYLGIEQELLKQWELFDIQCMKPFQYIMARCILDTLGSTQQNVSKLDTKKYIFYNEQNSGRTTGYVLPLLHLLKQKNNNIDTVLIITKSAQESRGLCATITALDPSARCLIIDSYIEPEDSNPKYTDCSINTISGNADRQTNELSASISSFNALKEITSDSGRYNILIASIERIEALLHDTRVSKHRLARIGCVIFDDLCSYLDKGAVVSNIYRSIRAAQVFSNQCNGIPRKPPASTIRAQVNANLHTDIHVMCIVGSVGDGFCKFATDYLGGYWLYDLKNGTKQRIVGDGRTDAIRLEVDLESTPEIVNLSSGNGRAHQLPIEHSICKVPSTKNKRDRQYILECLVYHYLNLPTFQVHHMLPPLIKKPRSPYQCIVFVSNRAQQRQLSMLQAFRDISVRLGSDITAEERARNLNAFREGTKPVMIATDASIAGCIFDNVRYVINYNPPKSMEIYRNRAGIAGKNTGSVCITLYNKLEYNEFSKILKALKKRVSIHTAPSQDYMYRYNAKWLERFANELSAMQPGFILPFEEKAKELLQTHDINDLFSKTAAILLGMGTGEPISQTSILSERRGFTAVTVFDGSANARLTIDEIKSLVARQLPDINISSLMGRYARTESGYIVDINSQHLEVLLRSVSNEPNICFEIARELPQLIMGEETKLNRAKGHMSKLPWRYYKIRRLRMQKRML